MNIFNFLVEITLKYSRHHLTNHHNQKVYPNMPEPLKKIEKQQFWIKKLNPET